MSALPILYLDEHLVVVHKPAGLLVHRTVLDYHETRFALQCVRDQLGRRVYPVHRLDKGTSGALAFALSPDVAQAMNTLFETRQVHKEYLAIVRGWPSLHGQIDHPLQREAALAGQREDRSGSSPQAALTHYRRLATVELPWAIDRYPTSRYALLALQPLTGRHHQLRRHLKHISHPIIGDATHGKGRHNRAFAAAFGTPRLLLVHTQLGFAHPATGEPVQIHCPPAADFAAVQHALGWCAAA
ncbi:pseudouridine synthase [Chitiniphilus purpureus]|uniref:Pseudouridine synthase n=1 Tax=Chitiniphilus purpureus TaxID=2981137 RepID=A0ABY6DHV0_9NEIS|nr:pseudouridine synthase [Chitiniphilus sp. CD1]UXY13902.1 pseudouridine synthase [Chitiniphilus sp. CD1]